VVATEKTGGVGHSLESLLHLDDRGEHANVVAAGQGVVVASFARRTLLEWTTGHDRVAQAIASRCDSRESGTYLLAGNSPDMGDALEPSRRRQQVLDAADERDLLEVSLT
jgi:hypothetical protein